MNDISIIVNFIHFDDQRVKVMDVDWLRQGQCEAKHPPIC